MMCNDEQMVTWGVKISKCQWTINQFKTDTRSLCPPFPTAQFPRRPVY